MARSKPIKAKESKLTEKAASSSKAVKPSKLGKKVQVERVEDEPSGEDSEDEDAEDNDSDEDEDEDVDEEGMTRLMKALGEDGLDDFAQAELRALAGEDSDEEGSEVEGNESEGGEEVEGNENEEEDEDVEDDDDEEHDEEEEEEEDEEGSVDEEEEEEVVALDEVDDVEEDIVPKQKVEIDNKVSLRCYSTKCTWGLIGLYRLLSTGYGRPLNWTPVCHGQRH